MKSSTKILTKGFVKKWQSILLLFLVQIFCSCKNDSVGKLIEEFQSNKYIRTIETNNYAIKFRYIPEVLYYLKNKNLNQDQLVTKNLIDSLKLASSGKYGLMFIMELSLKAKTINSDIFIDDLIYSPINNGDYQSTLNRYLFGSKNNIWLEVNGKKHKPLNLHMVRTWGITRSRNFTLQFDHPDQIGLSSSRYVSLVIDGLVPGNNRQKIDWSLPNKLNGKFI